MRTLNPREIGDQHVKDVTAEVKHYLSTGTYLNNCSVVTATAKFILEHQKETTQVIGKFEAENTNTHPDLLLFTVDGSVTPVNLYKIKNSQTIQPKNLGAKSFIKKYFKAPELQYDFNGFFDLVYNDYLRDMVGTIRDASDEVDTLQNYRKVLRESGVKFNDDSKEIKSRLLYELREKCFSLFLKQYNEKSKGMENAFNELFMTNSFNVISRYRDNKFISVEEFKVVVPEIDEVSILKIGANTVGFSIDNIILMMRFKFESGPASSIKLATSFTEKKPIDAVADENKSSLLFFKNAISKRLKKSLNVKDQNAIGKCSESIFYSQLLEMMGDVKQIDSQNFIVMFNNYSDKVPNKDIKDIVKSTVDTAKSLIKFLDKKYDGYSIESIELVPDNYLKNRLDTADLELVLKSNGKYATEPVSLKATRENTGSITCKNPGVGQIMGSTYFDLDQTSLSVLVDQLKSSFINNDDNRRYVMEQVSSNIGLQLVNADQKNLIKGIQAVLGRAVVVIIFYKQNKHVILEHDENAIKNLLVQINTPSNIQNTLVWLDGKEQVSLRVKFSGGKKRGWSSLKLACSHNFSLIQG
ncbi:MAG TPA: hypothetical protein VJY63_08940 [Marinospirillum sp.]|uniref:hypothetical protein n=1 Tax=Marinospirillum sp. TaxID=2183934 RepID=UPI002B49055C|nr:hypothetical protein [Marinospirillum sp.]HKM16027.1 hypothetical protein [Marinospirillum sp.]